MGQGRAFKIMICFIVLDTLKLSESLQILVLTKKNRKFKKKEKYIFNNNYTEYAFYF